MSVDRDHGFRVPPILYSNMVIDSSSFYRNKRKRYEKHKTTSSNNSLSVCTGQWVPDRGYHLHIHPGAQTPLFSKCSQKLLVKWGLSTPGTV